MFTCTHPHYVDSTVLVQYWNFCIFDQLWQGLREGWQKARLGVSDRGSSPYLSSIWPVMAGPEGGVAEGQAWRVRQRQQPLPQFYLTSYGRAWGRGGRRPGLACQTEAAALTSVLFDQLWQSLREGWQKARLGVSDRGSSPYLSSIWPVMAEPEGGVAEGQAWRVRQRQQPLPQFYLTSYGRAWGRGGRRPGLACQTEAAALTSVLFDQLWQSLREGWQKARLGVSDRGSSPYLSSIWPVMAEPEGGVAEGQAWRVRQRQQPLPQFPCCRAESSQSHTCQSERNVLSITMGQRSTRLKMLTLHRQVF